MGFGALLLRVIRIALAISLLIQPPHQVFADTPRSTDDREERKIQLVIYALNTHRTYRELVKIFNREADRAFLTKALAANIDVPVKLRYIERNGISIQFGEERQTLFVKDLRKTRFALNKREFGFNPEESAEAAVNRLKRELADSGAVRYLLPEAQAALGKFALVTYIITAATIASACMLENWNSNLSCVYHGVTWPLAVVALGIGGVALGLDKLKEYFSQHGFDVKELTCPDADQPLRATVAGTEDKLAVELRQKKSGQPDSLAFIPSVGEKVTLYFKDEWELDTERTKVKLDPQGFELIAKGAKNLRRICLGRDSKAAMVQYLKEKTSQTTIVPKFSEPAKNAK